ncbi:MAG TPA: F0F1 ATP synthase subunit gamma [Alphaproteobacteria bacterium]|nr:F0F1 ATP synthase subunit gamma [Alphaproteobacteria bacterium]
MTQLAEIEAHIGSMAELLDVVGAMRSLAGMRRQEAQRALPGIRRYAEVMAAAIGDALLLAPPGLDGTSTDHGRQALVLFLAEHGFVGGFNERLIEAARQSLKPRDVLLVVGSRGAAQAAERGLLPGWTSTAPTRTPAAIDTIRRLTAELYRRMARGEIERIETVYAAVQRTGAPTIERRRVLPVDTKPLRHSRTPPSPLHNLRPTVLVETLISEYVFALLTEAAVESIATENAARFSTMDAAHENVGKKLDELRQNARQARQAEITSELLDLVAGADAQVPV